MGKTLIVVAVVVLLAGTAIFWRSASAVDLAEAQSVTVAVGEAVGFCPAWEVHDDLPEPQVVTGEEIERFAQAWEAENASIINRRYTQDGEVLCGPLRLTVKMQDGTQHRLYACDPQRFQQPMLDWIERNACVFEPVKDGSP